MHDFCNLLSLLPTEIPTIQIILGILIATGVIVILIIIVKQLSSPNKLLGLQKAFKNGNYKQAIKIGKEYLEKHGSNPDVNYLLAESYYALHKYNEALGEYQKTDQRETQSKIIKYTNLHEKLAELYEMSKEYEKASQELVDLKNKNPNNFEYCYKLGTLSEKRSKIELAAKFYIEAVKIKANHVPSLVNLGVIFTCAKRFTDAEHYLSQATRFEPNNARALYHLGIVKKNQNEPNEALKLFEQAARSKEFRERSLVERGRIYIVKGKYPDAIIELERALNNIDDNIENRNRILNIRYMLGCCYEETKKLEKAVEHFKAIHDKNPSFKDVSEKLRTYDDIALGDEMKDFLIASDEEFLTICKNMLVTKLGKAITEVQPIGKDAIQFVTHDKDIKWLNSQKSAEVFRIYRTHNPVSEKEVADIIDVAKKHGAHKSTLISSSSFTPQAQNYAKERPVVLINKNQLSAILSGK